MRRKRHTLVVLAMRLNLERKLLLQIGLVLILGVVALGISEYRHIRADAEAELLTSAEHVNDVLMAARRTYHKQFFESGLSVSAENSSLFPIHSMGAISKELINFTKDGFSFNNVSDNARNPRHQADAVELEAIEAFRRDPEQELRFVPYKDEKGQPYYHYSRPLWVEPYCLSCHGERASAPDAIQSQYEGAYGYQVGDLRGILSIKLPAAEMLHRVKQQLYLQIFWIAVLTFIIGVLIAATVRDQVTRPLAAIASAARRIGQGELDDPINIKANMDLQGLAGDLQAMASQLRLDKESITRERSFLKSIITAIPDLVWLKDASGKYLLCNAQCERLFGAAEDEIIGKTDYDLVEKALADMFRENDRRAIEKGKPSVNLEQVTYADDGHTEWLETIKTPLFDKAGLLIGVLGIGRDISSLHQAEGKLREERDIKERYLNTMQVMMVALDKSGGISLINRAGYELLGYEKGELEGKNWFATCLPEPEGTEQVYPVFLKIMSGEVEQASHFENHVRCKDGSLRLVSWHNADLKDDEGNVIGLVSSGLDVTEKRAAEKKIRDDEKRYREIFNATSEAIFIHDAKTGRIMDVNEQMLQMYGVSRDEAMVLTAAASSSGVEPYTEANAHEKIRLTVEEGPQTFEWHAKRKDGSLFWVEVSTRASDIGDEKRVLAVVRDITVRKELVSKLADLAASNRRILDSTAEGIFGLDTEGRHTFVNPAGAKMLGYETEELIGMPSHETWHHHYPSGDDYPSCDCPVRGTLNTGEPSSGEEWFIHKDGHFFPVSYHSSPIFEDGELSGAVVSFTDITDKREADKKIHHLAYYDELTGLPNRSLLLDRISQQLATSQRTKSKGALVLFNIDRFANINSARGHGFGDQVLVAFGELMQRNIGKGDTLARLSADEFALLIPNIGTKQSKVIRYVVNLMERIQDGVQQPLSVSGELLNLTLSIGATLLPEIVTEEPADTLRRIDAAMHRAKAAGGNQYAFFEESMGESIQKRYTIERELHRAVFNGELRLFLQPQVNARGELMGAEALVRWEHPERGLVPPGVFIPVAEESDLIVELGNWVLRESLGLMAKSVVTGNVLKLSVNLSPRQFSKPGFVAGIKNIITETGADPNHLTLEVTEGLFIDDIADVIAKMDELVSLGIKFSIDDFGTGYSSLSYLKRLPIDELKIDKSFIQDAPMRSDDAALVETILLVSKSMHLRVVAEGVETEEQASFLNERAEVIHQGYLYGKPRPAVEWLGEWFPNNH